jgi:hypothetical protein
MLIVRGEVRMANCVQNPDEAVQIVMVCALEVEIIQFRERYMLRRTTCYHARSIWWICMVIVADTSLVHG